jgi:hypothetical protein
MNRVTKATAHGRWVAGIVSLILLLVVAPLAARAHISEHGVGSRGDCAVCDLVRGSVAITPPAPPSPAALAPPAVEVLLDRPASAPRLAPSPIHPARGPPLV